MKTLRVSNLGPIKDASVAFGNLTVLVGPQATGKSLFLQLLKLLLDIGPIRDEFKRFNLDWGGLLENFLELYFGEGMSGIYDPERTHIEADGKAVTLTQLIGRGRRDKEERLFFIPAQRVLSLREGLTRPFTDYRAGDPFVVREFSEKLHWLKNWLKNQAPTLDTLTAVQSYYWAATSGVHIRPGSPQARQLQLAGLALPKSNHKRLVHSCRGDPCDRPQGSRAQQGEYKICSYHRRSAVYECPVVRFRKQVSL